LRVIDHDDDDDDDDVDGSEKPSEVDTDSFVRLQMATWKPATQRKSEPFPRHTERKDTEFDSISCSGPVCNISASETSSPATTNHTSANRHDSIMYRSGWVGSQSISEEASSVKKTDRISSEKCAGSSRRKNASQNVVDGHQQRGRFHLSDLDLVTSDNVAGQSADAASQRRQHSSVGTKRKSSTGK